MKKRCLCLLLAAVMLITVFPLSVHAVEGTRIEEIAQVSLNVTPPSAGTGSTDAKSKIAVTGEGIGSYYATWKDYTGYMVPEPTEIDFVEGNTYYAVITLFAAEGYSFKKGEGHSLDIDACDYCFGGEVNVTGGELYNNKANVRSAANPEYMKIWITVKAGEAAKCTVSFDPGTGTGEMAPVTVNTGETYELPACTFTHANAERAFYRWDVDGELYEPGVKIAVNKDTVVTAVWKYTGAAATVDNAVDKSTTEVLGALTLTDTRTGEMTTATVYDETAASSFVNPNTPTVNAMIEEAQGVLAEKAGEKAGGSELTTVKDGVENLKVVKFEDSRTFTYSYLKDEAGDYYQALTIEGTYYKIWQYTVVLEAEYASAEAVVKLGDVDFDGNITASDARLALRRAVDLEDYAPGSKEFIACDVDLDHAVTASDARSILRAAVDLEDPDTWGK